MSTALFIPKAKYRVTENYGVFIKDEILTFDMGGYNRYDESYDYYFYDALGKHKEIFLNAKWPSGDEPIGSQEAQALLRLFELLPSSAEPSS